MSEPSGHEGDRPLQWAHQDSEATDNACMGCVRRTKVGLEAAK